MGVTDRLWDALTTVIRMNDKVERMAGGMKAQQEKLELLTERVIRLEATLHLLMTQRTASAPPRPKLARKDPQE